MPVCQTSNVHKRPSVDGCIGPSGSGGCIQHDTEEESRCHRSFHRFTTIGHDFVSTESAVDISLKKHELLIRQSVDTLLTSERSNFFSEMLTTDRDHKITDLVLDKDKDEHESNAERGER